MSQGFRGVLVPVVTPVRGDLTIDGQRFAGICRGLLDEGADGLAVFGTTSEANSLPARARMAALEHLVASGIDPARLMPGIGACALGEAAELLAHAGHLGCGGGLLLPPFYYKGVSDEGLYRFVAGTIDTARAPAPVYLYHIPPVAQVGYGLELIGRLVAAFPDVVVGLKDSSGDFDNTRAIITGFPGFDVFCGSEVFLLDALRIGGAGCITATGNVNAAGIRKVFLGWRGEKADALQARASEIRHTIQQFPMIPALKAIIARRQGDDGWKTVLPPLTALDNETESRLFAAIDGIGFV